MSNTELANCLMMLFLGIVLGICIYGIYNDVTEQNEAVNKSLERNKFDGLRFEANYTHPSALEHAKTYDEKGIWVCVNVRDMTYERGLEVCRHEMAHEIFAEYCQDNMDQCINITK